MNILLGSKSPRRRELLAGLDIPYQIVDIKSREDYPHNLKRGDIPLFIAREKADAYRSQLKTDDLLITADTIVWCDDQMLGKPADRAEAIQMLQQLSGKTHQVYTAVCLTTTTRQETDVDCTDVTFQQLTQQEIEQYIDHYRPYDKAGAYGVQEWIGYVAVSKLNGSFYNVMGLPTHLLWNKIAQFLHN